MTLNKWQLKAMVTGTVTSGSDWDGKSLGEIYLTLRKQGVANQAALDVVETIKDNRLWAMTGSQVPHISKVQAIDWLLEANVMPCEAMRRVYGANPPRIAYEIAEVTWQDQNRQHHQECTKLFGAEEWGA